MYKRQPQAKEAPFAEAPPGMLGLETCLPVVLEALDPERSRDSLDIAAVALRLLSWQPARIASLESQGLALEAGNPANICVFDPAEQWVVDPVALASPAHNTPYGGRTLHGRVRHTIYRGEPVVISSEARR